MCLIKQIFNKLHTKYHPQLNNITKAFPRHCLGNLMYAYLKQQSRRDCMFIAMWKHKAPYDPGAGRMLEVLCCGKYITPSSIPQ